MEIVINKSSYEHGNYAQGKGTPPDTYRCPMSSPAAVLQTPRPVAQSQLGFMTDRRSPVQRGSLFVTYRSRQRNVGKLGSLMTPRSRNFDYYYVNNRAHTNLDKPNTTPWVKSLCAQPVDEIFSKYKRQFEIQRMKQLWTKTFTTPGEKALLDVWNKNDSKKFGSRKDEPRKVKSPASFSTKSSRRSGNKEVTDGGEDSRGSPPLHNTPESDRYDLDDLESIPPLPVPEPTAIEIIKIPHEHKQPDLEEMETEKEVTDICEEGNDNEHLNNLNLVVNSDYYDQFKRQEPRLPHIKSSRVEVHTARQYMSGEQMLPPVGESKHVTESRPFTPAKRFRYKLMGKTPILPSSKHITEKRSQGDTKLPYLSENG